MAARVYDIYDLSSPFVPATAPAVTMPTAAQRQAYWERLAESRLFNGSVILLVFAAFVYLLGTILDATPLGQVTGTQNVALWLGGIVGAFGVAGAITAFLVATVRRVQTEVGR